jgi:Holliday junction resolvasome RuvABC ATP-dependent DNA helicase subunit
MAGLAASASTTFGPPETGKTSMKELLLGEIEQVQRIIATCVEPEPRNERATLEAVLAVLDRRDVVAAINRLRAGLGLRTAK